MAVFKAEPYISKRAQTLANNETSTLLGPKAGHCEGRRNRQYPQPGNICTVHYTAYLMMDDDGIPHDETKEKTPGPVFDSTYARGKPFKFKLGQSK